MNNSEMPGNVDKKNEAVASSDHTGTESDSDHSGSDCDNDKTQTITKSGQGGKFDKPKREVDPDTTGIDIQSDKQ